MKKDIRLAICLVVIILLGIFCLFRLFADKEIEEEGESNNHQANPTPKTFVISDDDKNKVVLTGIKFYTVKLSTMNIESAEAAVDGKFELTPMHICEYVADALEDEEIEIKINSAELDDDICVVDMGDSIKAISEKNPRLEMLVLDAVAMSILDNCHEVTGVTFTIDKNTYSTANIQLNDKEVYLKQ